MEVPPPKLEQLILPSQPQPQNYVVLRLPFNLASWDRPRLKKTLKTTLLVLSVAATLYVIWPSKPTVNVARVRLRHLRIHTKPHIAIDVAIDATVKVENKAVYSMDYTGLHVAVGYRGRELGHVVSGGGHVRGMGSSYVDATVEFDGVVVVSDWLYLLEDLTKGLIEFTTLTQVNGSLHFFMCQIPLKVKLSCEIDVNINHQTVTHQNCYPEFEGHKEEGPSTYNLTTNETFFDNNVYVSSNNSAKHSPKHEYESSVT